MPKNGVNTCPQFRSNISFCSENCSNHDCLSDPIFEQCSNYSSYFVRAVHQFPIMPLRANTINISLQPFHLLLRRHPSLVLSPPSLSLQEHIYSAVLKIQAVRLHWNRGSFFSRHQGFTLPQQMASLSEISQVRYFSISLFIVFPPSLFLRFILSLFSFRILGTTLSSQ